MGVYLNPGNDGFRKMVNSDIYVDKTRLIDYTNKVINTMQQYICVSRPRRFGKSMAAGMLAAYYSRDCDSSKLFSKFEIAHCESFDRYLNKYNVISVNMQELLSQCTCIDDMIKLLERSVLWELLDVYSDVRYFDNTNLARSMQDIYTEKKCPFIVIIDEWDCIFREYKTDKIGRAHV